MNYVIKDETIAFTINCNIYNRDTIMKVAYLFIDRYYVYLDFIREQPGYMQIELSPKKGVHSKTKEAAGEFMNELLNQKLRDEIEKKTESVRELVLARALYTSYLDESEDEEETNYNINSIAKDWFDGAN